MISMDTSREMPEFIRSEEAGSITPLYIYVVFVGKSRSIEVS